MLFDLLPNDISEDITEESLDKFVRNINDLPVEPAESFLVNRVLRGLEHFRVRKSNPEVANVLALQSELDANAVESSYTLLNVFIWAIPILGFIGTVIGISAAVGAFSGSLEQAQDISVLKDSLNNVTSGLAVAFDTTLVALVMSMLVMFPSSSLRKAEEDLLSSVDEYCNENLLKRLSDGREAGEPGALSDAQVVRREVAAAMSAQLEAWNARLKAIGKTITTDVVEGWGALNKEMLRQQQENVEQVHDVDQMAAGFLRTLDRLAQQTESVQGQVAAAISASAGAIEGHCAALEKGLAGLNRALEELGQKRIVVETLGRPGLFGRLLRRNNRA
jgi:hypothetical protein